MIGIADQKLWNLGVGLLSFDLDFWSMILSLHSVFFCFTTRNSSSARLGQNSRTSTSIRGMGYLLLTVKASLFILIILN